jgi:hypothetical protein
MTTTKLGERWQLIQCKLVAYCVALGNVLACSYHEFRHYRSRAVAVAAYQDKFDVFMLNPAVSRTRFNPIHSVGLQIQSF